MKTPYSHVHALGDYVFAARGGAIHSFNLLSGAHVSTWKHPDVEKQAVDTTEAKAVDTVDETKDDVDMDAAVTSANEPPVKRQRLDEAGEAKTTDEGEAEEGNDQAQPKRGKKQGRKSKHQSHGASQRAPSVTDKALIVLITSTNDGKHVVAVSGHDKIIWVFEHLGDGVLLQLSQRRMPKRPIDLVIGPDNTIITADKFGDVYSLPLLFDPLTSSAAPANPSLIVPKTSKPSATALTVHSKRNRQALESQLRQYEARARNGESTEKPPTEEPTFESQLLLGHVSMLTALTLAESEGKRYILTADRDEHVRVSRYIPQAHVIEGFCLGHREFIAAMILPAGRGDVLVSGGGDTDLYVWDWKRGARLSTTSVLSLAQVIAPETTKVAVSSMATLLYQKDGETLTYVLAICEDIKAIFAWQLTDDNQLNHPSAIQLPGNPLGLDTSFSSPTTPRIVVALDPSADTAPFKSLNIFSLTMNEGRLSSDECSGVDDDVLTAGEADVTPEDVRKWLYGTEQLRKQEYGGEEEEEEEPIPASAVETSMAAEITAE